MLIRLSRIIVGGVLTVCLLPLNAAASGTWVADDIGVTQSSRGVATSAKPLHSPVALAQENARIVSVGWRYQLMSAAPDGLQVKLCTPTRCMPLEGGSGQSRGLAGEPAATQLTFVYFIAGKGRVNPPLQVISNQVLVNYR
ncbi:flagellar protein FlhE [Yersinia massiliensis]|jgi:flagellar protein FlhE|uniref:Flagellar protein FlhE n=3 Tax=Yersinia TaxID=629 RepID=A0A2R4NNQ2_9GAMM|nr:MULTISPECIES: flagellar protein FlhE [Yersinia]HEC1648561.1 flagellar protein FlhE [Yersinia enterocolitica]ATM86320.1 flagellar protein FlhE [Yersinia frederiksenii]AVX37747.1 flagellar protein FlhE [Yersinia massiliensis]MCB5306592.1 flagellar protein FlhE [Yersinia massiliensis]MCB5317230.1 flagellar protein FlhE [Yersinia massiliensis]